MADQPAQSTKQQYFNAYLQYAALDAERQNAQKNKEQWNKQAQFEQAQQAFWGFDDQLTQEERNDPTLAAAEVRMAKDWLTQEQQGNATLDADWKEYYQQRRDELAKVAYRDAFALGVDPESSHEDKVVAKLIMGETRAHVNEQERQIDRYFIQLDTLARNISTLPEDKRLQREQRLENLRGKLPQDELRNKEYLHILQNLDTYKDSLSNSQKAYYENRLSEIRPHIDLEKIPEKYRSQEQSAVKKARYGYALKQLHENTDNLSDLQKQQYEHNINALSSQVAVGDVPSEYVYAEYTRLDKQLDGDNAGNNKELSQRKRALEQRFSREFSSYIVALNKLNDRSAKLTPQQRTQLENQVRQQRKMIPSQVIPDALIGHEYELLAKDLDASQDIQTRQELSKRMRQLEGRSGAIQMHKNELQNLRGYPIDEVPVKWGQNQEERTQYWKDAQKSYFQLTEGIPKGIKSKTPAEKGLAKLYKLYSIRDQENIKAANNQTFNKLQARQMAVNVGRPMANALAETLPKYAEILRIEGQLQDPSVQNKEALREKHAQLFDQVETSLISNPGLSKKLATELRTAQERAGVEAEEIKNDFKKNYKGPDKREQVAKRINASAQMLSGIKDHVNLLSSWSANPVSKQDMEKGRLEMLKKQQARPQQEIFDQGVQNRAFSAGAQYLQETGNTYERSIREVDALGQQYNGKKRAFKLQNSNQQKQPVSQKFLEL